LVKNVNNALPLKRPNLVSIFGYAAVESTVNDFTPLSFGRIQPNQSVPGLLYVGGGSGANNPAYISDYICAFGDRAYEYGTSLLWDTVNVNPVVDQATDVCIVAINAYATEGLRDSISVLHYLMLIKISSGWDRMGLHDDYSDSIILNVANKCANTVVVIENAGIRLVDTFYSHPNITAIIYAHLAGQDAGRALTSLVYGDVSFSGKLPYSMHYSSPHALYRANRTSQP
jgi:beta-glucosidase